MSMSKLYTVKFIGCHPYFCALLLIAKGETVGNQTHENPKVESNCDFRDIKVHSQVNIPDTRKLCPGEFQTS